MLNVMKRKMKKEFCIVLIVFMIVAALGLLLHNFYDESSVLYKMLMGLDMLVIMAFALVSIHYFFTVKNNCMKYSKMQYFQHNMTAISVHDQISYILFDINKLKFYDWCIEKHNEGHKVFIFEYYMPYPFKAIWSKEIVSSLTPENNGKKGIEKLFIVK